MRAQEEIKRRPRSVQIVIQVMLTRMALDKFPSGGETDQERQSMAWECLKQFDLLRQEANHMEPDQDKLARQILKRLESSNWKTIIAPELKEIELS